MLNRKEFRNHWRTANPLLASIDSPLWLPERLDGRRPSRYFVNVTRQIGSATPGSEFWPWCTRHCAGQVLCYSSSPTDGEWWGFTHKADVALWLLKWA